MGLIPVDRTSKMVKSLNILIPFLLVENARPWEERIQNTNILETKAVNARESVIIGLIALDIQFRGLIIALFGSSVISWAVVKSGVVRIATSKILTCVPESSVSIALITSQTMTSRIV